MLLELPVENVGDLEQEVAARGSGHARPAWKRRLRGIGSRFDIGGGAFDEQADDFVGVGRIAVLESGSGDPLAVDVVRKGLCVSST